MIIETVVPSPAFPAEYSTVSHFTFPTFDRLDFPRTMGITKFTRRNDRSRPADESVTDTIIEINWQTVDWMGLLADHSQWKPDAIAYLVHVIRADLIRSLLPAEAINDEFIDQVVQQSVVSILEQREEFPDEGSFLDWATSISRQVLSASIRRASSLRSDPTRPDSQRPSNELDHSSKRDPHRFSSHCQRKTHA